MIQFKNVNLAINGKEVLHDISFTIPEDQKTVIIGKSGCGKTVLMKTMEGLFKPQSGSITVDEVEVTDNASDKRNPVLSKIAMLFQYAALLDSFSVYQNVALPLVERRSNTDIEIETEVMSVLGFVGLEQCSDLYPSELSGGMKKRIGLARALVTNPKYLILDEPTTGLDPFTAEEVMTFLKKVIDQKNVIPIAITHDPYCINELGDYIIMMDAGRILFTGTKLQLENHPQRTLRTFYDSFFQNPRME